MERNLTGLKRLIRAKTAIGTLPEITEYTATGNPATFSTNLIRPLQSFEIPFSPVQSGSGDPSPSNVRPISGWPGVTVTANGQTILAAWESVAGVVYGGTVDLVTGVMTVTHFCIDGSNPDLNVTRDSSNDTIVNGAMSFADNNFPSAAVDISLISNRFSVSIPSGQSGKTVHYNGTLWFNMPRSDFGNDTGADAIKQWLADHPTIWVYKMSTSQTVQLTPVEIKTIIGQNSISTNTNGTNTIKYLKRG